MVSYLYMSPSFDAELLKLYPLIAEFVYLWSVLLDLYNIWAIFLYVVYVFEFFCLWKFMCWHNKFHSTHGSLWNTVDIYILVISERFFNMLHNTFTFFRGCVCDMLKPMVTWVQLVYHIFLKTKEYSVEFIQCFSPFIVFWLCVCVLFV